MSDQDVHTHDMQYEHEEEKQQANDVSDRHHHQSNNKNNQQTQDDHQYDDNYNPFTIPSQDIFQLVEQEKQQKEAHKRNLKTTKIWNKTSSNTATRQRTAGAGLDHNDDLNNNQQSGSSTASADDLKLDYLSKKNERSKFMKSTGGKLMKSKDGSTTNKKPASSSSSSLLNQSHLASTLSTVKNTENMNDFLSKKRDMFLIQMSLNTKKSEILKLEERARMKEDALRKSEIMLEEDATRFDLFLKEIDKKSHDSSKRAEQEIKNKNDKILELKKLNNEINKIENEMNKYEETLNACIKYKEFLDSLTPAEFLESQRLKKLERKQYKKQSIISCSNSKNNNNLLQINSSNNNNKVTSSQSSGGQTTPRQQANSNQPNNMINNNRSPRSNNRTMEASASSKRDSLISSKDELGSNDGNESKEGTAAASADNDDSDDDSVASEMYFTHPSQLLEIFSQLEERNLFLIQNVRETEENLESLKSKYNDIQIEINEKNSILNVNIQDLIGKIEYENQRSELLKQRTNSNSSKKLQFQLLAELTQKIRQVYASCGLDDGYTNSATGNSSGTNMNATSTSGNNTQQNSTNTNANNNNNTRQTNNKNKTNNTSSNGDGTLVPASSSSSAGGNANNNSTNGQSNNQADSNSSQSVHLSSLEMLRSCEIWLEFLLRKIGKMNPRQVVEAEKRKNQERRNAIRIEKKEAAQRQYEERLAKSVARANQEIFKKIGKPVMFRSRIEKKKVEKKVEKQQDEEQELIKKFFT